MDNRLFPFEEAFDRSTGYLQNLKGSTNLVMCLRISARINGSVREDMCLVEAKFVRPY
jgi:hypothetical protein